MFIFNTTVAAQIHIKLCSERIGNSTLILRLFCHFITRILQSQCTNK